MKEEKKDFVAPSNIKNMQTAIIVKTLLRNTNDSEKEFLEKLGIKEKNKSEEEIVKTLCMNALVDSTRAYVKINDTLSQINALIEVLLTDEQKEELNKQLKKVEEEKNGRN